MPFASNGRRILRLPEVKKLTGLSSTTIWRRSSKGAFPERVRLGEPRSRAVGWFEDEIHEWMDGLARVKVGEASASSS